MAIYVHSKSLCRFLLVSVFTTNLALARFLDFCGAVDVNNINYHDTNETDNSVDKAHKD